MKTGLIDDVRIYNRVLTDAEVAEIAAGVDVGGANDVAPAAPTGVTATGAAGSVTVAWAASPTAWRYSVYRGTTSGGPYTQIATDLTTTSGNSFTVS